jgi:Baseplate J-like protein
MANAVFNLSSLDSSIVGQLNSALLSALTAYSQTNDFNQGVLHDLIISLNATVGAALEQMIITNQASNSLAAVVANPSLADNSTVDQLVSNYRVTRLQAIAATGQINIVISSLIPTTIPANSIFTTSSGLVFITTSTFAGRTSSGLVVLPTDRLITPLGSNFVFTVDVACQTTGSVGNIPAGTSMTMNTPPTAYVKSFVNTSITSGQDLETNAALLARLNAGAAINAWGNRSSIQNVIQTAYPVVTAISAIGCGDAEMLRDRHGLFPASSGGRTDVYVLQPIAINVITVTATLLSKSGAVGTWQFGVNKSLAPGYYNITNILLPYQDLTTSGFLPATDTRGTDLSGVTNPPDIINVLESTYSRYQTSTITFVDTITNVTSITLGSTASYVVMFRLIPNLDVIQDFLLGQINRPLGSDVLTKAPVPIFCTLSFDLTISSSAPSPNLTLVASAISSAVQAQGFSDRLSASTISSAVLSVVPNCFVDTIAIAGNLRKPNGTILALSSGTSLTYTPDTANMTTPNTTVFFLSPEDIGITLLTI